MKNTIYYILILLLFLQCSKDDVMPIQNSNDKTKISKTNSPQYEPFGTLVTNAAEFSPRTFHTTTLFKNKLWVIGGFDRNRLNDIWNSFDGINWTKIEPIGDVFSPRSGHTTTMFNNKIWIIGGIDSNGNYLNDVWSSKNGLIWKKVLNAAPFSTRSKHATAVFDNRLWIVGGSNGRIQNSLDLDVKNDVWYTENGINWTQVNYKTNFPPRSNHTLTVFDNKLWVIGGIDGNIFNRLNDVWYSEDGIDWTKATDGNSYTTLSHFSPRSSHTTNVLGNELWLIGGFTRSNVGRRIYLNDIWSSTDGHEWIRVTQAAAFQKRAVHTTTFFMDKLWLIGGSTSTRGEYKNDVWIIN
jgi:N-acetylneuraminic acid mutarotase